MNSIPSQPFRVESTLAYWFALTVAILLLAACRSLSALFAAPPSAAEGSGPQASPVMPLAELPATGNAVAVDVSPDGKWLATGGDDAHVSIWNLETAELAYRLPTRGTLYVCRFSPDGRLVATGSLKGMVKIWGLNEGSLEASFFENADGIRSLAFSPDGRWLASGGMDRCLRVIDTRSWQIVHEQPGQTQWVEGLAFSADSRSLYSIAGSWAEHPAIPQLTRWSVNVADNPEAPLTLTPIKAVKAHENTSDNLGVTDDGKWVITPSADSRIRVWDATTLELLRTFSINQGVHRVHVINGDPPLLLAGGQLGAVSVWDLSAGEVVARYSGHSTHVFDVTATPDGRLLITAGEDDRFLFWPGPVEKPDAQLERFLDRITSMPHNANADAEGQ